MSTIENSTTGQIKILPFHKTDPTALSIELQKPSKKDGKTQVYGTPTLEGKRVVVQTPWMRSTSGWTAIESQYGPMYRVGLSLQNPPEQKKVNGKLIDRFVKWVDQIDSGALEFVKSHWSDLVPSGEPCPNDATLRECLTSIHQPEYQEYPERLQFSFNDMVDNGGRYKGGVFQRGFNKETQQLESSSFVEESKCSKVKRHARVRFQTFIKSFYFSKDMESLRFGFNWTVQKMLFYTVLDDLVDEDVCMTYTFNDNYDDLELDSSVADESPRSGSTTVSETFGMSNIPKKVQLEVIESGGGGKRKRNAVPTTAGTTASKKNKVV